MQSSTLYAKLEKDFIKDEMLDDWKEFVSELKYVKRDFLDKGMGVVCDFAEKINKVYTAVFPSKKVMQKIVDDNVENAMLFVHHAAVWDIRNAPNVFTPMDEQMLEKFRQNKISVYCLHVPLDNFCKQGTSVTLAKALGIRELEPFGKYYGAMAGVIAKQQINLNELKQRFEKAVGHKIKLYDYGPEITTPAFVAGGGNDLEILGQLKEKANTLITGISAKSDYSKKAHQFAEENKINILGGTHYSTEKFSMIAMADYFQNLGLGSEFVQDEPVFEDM
ncbi:MAG: Nif3-like dinuclear metal center hexameric protein [Candidatus Nanoarchaeia archaeon]